MLSQQGGEFLFYLIVSLDGRKRTDQRRNRFLSQSALSVLWKLYSGEVLDGQKLSLDEWKQKVVI